MQNIFQALDFFCMRSPILSADVFKEDLTSFPDHYLDKLWDLAQNPLIKEAVAVSSISLFHSLSNLSPCYPTSKREETARSFMRYLIRMSTRPTPFGIFSGVSFGTFGTEYIISRKDLKEHTKRTRPDMEWIYLVIAKMEQDENLLHNLTVTTNTMAYEKGNRLYLPYLIRLNESNKNTANFQIDRISVNNTSAVKEALEIAHHSISIKALISKLYEQNPEATREEITGFVYQLVKQELLITNLRPPLINVNPLDYLIKCLDGLDNAEYYLNELNEISSMIHQYDTLALGEGIDMYLQIQHKMKSLADCKNLLQVDLKIETNSVMLPQNVKEEVEKAANALWHINDPEIGFPHMSSYKNDFMERYGTSREVPILELLDEETGLDAPATYEFPSSKRSVDRLSTNAKKHKNYLLSQWIMEAITQGEQEVILDEERIKKLSVNTLDSCYAPRSFELYFSLSASSEEDVEHGNFTLTCGPTSQSQGAGRSIGRFSDLLGPEVITSIANVRQLEQSMYPDAILAEIVYLPVDGRASNVALTQSNTEYEIALATNSLHSDKVIPLSDLLVGIDQHGFYLRSRKLGKQIIPTVNHMLNVNHAPNVYRFLREVAAERHASIKGFNLEIFDSFPYLPRIRYSRCILSSARWIINWETIPLKKGENFASWHKRFEQYRTKWKLPRYVYLTESDTRLLLDLEESTHVEQIFLNYNKLGEEGGVILTELGHSFDQFTTCNQKPYCTEFVFPVIRTEPSELTTQVPVRNYEVIPFGQRLRLPGGDCLYVKWYGNSEKIDTFLGEQLRAFCEAARQNDWAKGIFFMRYADPDNHIRIRFFGPPKNLYEKLLPELHNFAASCYQQGLLTNMVIDTYEPEIERYGGPELISLAEQWFCLDSDIVMNWLSLEQRGALPIEKDLLAIISVIDIMEQFGLSFDEQFQFLDKQIHYKDYLGEFRNKRPLYVKLADARGGFTNLAQSEAGQYVLPAFQARCNILHFYADQIKRKAEAGTGYVRPKEVMSSLIHMHLNRLYGINRADEKRILTMSRHTLHGLQYIRRKE